MTFACVHQAGQYLICRTLQPSPWPAQLGPPQAGCQYDILHYFFMVGFARRGVIILLLRIIVAVSVWKYCSIGVWQEYVVRCPGHPIDRKNAFVCIIFAVRTMANSRLPTGETERFVLRMCQLLFLHSYI